MSYLSEWYRLQELSGQGGAAAGALAVEQIELADLIAEALNQQLAALVAAGAFPAKGGHIPDIDIMQTGPAAQVISQGKGFRRGGADAVSLEIRVEPADVPGNLRTQFAGDKLRDILQFLLAVVEARDHQGRNLQPDIRLAGYMLQRLQHRPQPGLADIPVKLIGKGLQIDIDRIEKIPGVIDGLRGHIAVTDKEIGQPLFPGQPAALPAQFHENRRLGVSIGEAGAALLAGGSDQFLGGGAAADQVVMQPGILADLPVLAEIALEIAADRGNGKTAAARLKVKQRLFLNRIDMRGADRLIIQRIQPPPHISPHAAHAYMALLNMAAEMAQFAYHLLVIGRLP